MFWWPKGIVVLHGSVINECLNRGGHIQAGQWWSVPLGSASPWRLSGGSVAPPVVLWSDWMALHPPETRTSYSSHSAKSSNVGIGVRMRLTKRLNCPQVMWQLWQQTWHMWRALNISCISLLIWMLSFFRAERNASGRRLGGVCPAGGSGSASRCPPSSTTDWSWSACVCGSRCLGRLTKSSR